MWRFYMGYSFQFNDYLVIDDQIHAIGLIQLYVLPIDRKELLPFNLESLKL